MASCLRVTLDDDDEAAFAAIVQRHSGMVWGVCRRVLHDPNDVDDAFQAVFLVLLNRSASLRQRDSLASWLQSVAWRLARKAKVQAIHRKKKEARAPLIADAAAPGPAEQPDLRDVLDEELERLPEKYREPLILCYLEGKSYTEAADCLGWPPGTVSGRLARGREVLRRRLCSRGVAPGLALITAKSFEPVTAPVAGAGAGCHR